MMRHYLSLHATIQCLALLLILFLSFSITAQQIPTKISSDEDQLYKELTDTRIKEHFGDLTNIATSSDNDKYLLIPQSISVSFEDDKVRLYNDIDLKKESESDLDIRTYLNRVALEYNGDYSFEIDYTLSSIYTASDFLFIKAEVTRKLMNKERLLDSILLDVYVKIVPPKKEARIYSVKRHEDNLYKFKLIQVATVENNFNGITTALTPKPEVKPGQYYLSSIPEGATIEFLQYADFAKKNTPAILTLPSTKYYIRISKNEYEPLDTIINIGVEKSKVFNLVPTFSFLNFTITPNQAEVAVDGAKLYYINGQSQKISKGRKTIEISANHYYPEKIIVDAIAGKVQPLNVNLKPKNGSLTIKTENQDAISATVFVDNTKIGNIPLNNYPLLEGNHTVRIEKKGFSTQGKFIEIKTNSVFDLKIGMYTLKSVIITTTPSNANIFVDDKLIGKSNTTVRLSIGRHSVKIEKDNFVTQTNTIDVLPDAPDKTTSNFILLPKNYELSVEGKPEEINYSISNTTGQTPDNISLPSGKYKIEFYKNNYFSETKRINLTATNTRLKVKLFPNSNLICVGFNSGLSTWNVSLGIVQHRIYVSGGLGINTINYEFKSPINHNDVSVDDISSYQPVGKISLNDTLRASGQLKLGFMLRYPFPFILNVGWAGSRSNNFQNVYQAKHDYVSFDGSVMRANQYFTTSNLYSKVYSTVTFGIVIPITKYVFVSSDYYLNSEIGPGFIFGGGIILDTNKK